MVRKTATIALAIAMCLGSIAPSWADSKFFHEDTGQWTVIGLRKTDGNNSFCKLTTGWANGSQLSINRDMVDNEIWMPYYNPTFKFVEGNDQALFYFRGGKLPRNGIKISYTYQRHAESEAHIIFRSMPEDFLSLIANASVLEIHFPGALPTVVVGLRGTRDGLALQRRCGEVYRSHWGDEAPVERDPGLVNRPIRS